MSPDLLRQNIEQVLERIEKAALKCGRKPQEIKLIAVTKTVDAETINLAFDFGIKDFGENRVQELLKKFDKVNPSASFHMIGHLQTNKVKYLIDKVKSIHSIDSLKLAQEVNKRFGEKQKSIEALIQIHTAKEETKFGLNPEELENFLNEAKNLKNIRFIGLMTIGTLTNDETEIRRCFSLLRNLRDTYSHFQSDNIDLRELSMGMTSDFEIAIEEGSTIVRIGTAIFGERN
ncbi:MAG: YggS family pyridoxal phosphate-dependent enzyme [Ignavibacteria bacterium]|jgi:pyridoxal phosphate enzyme (YggS family)|nr:YggS family pyridoxal phosphate-dependent enzyme [Ignavibacteria bacterium]MDH7527792.1 YggS family pyridoxal phosphate-dependent enzyme [Ignavibacteria bacterium]